VEPNATAPASSGQLSALTSELRARERRMVQAITHRRAARDPNRVYGQSLTVGQRVADAVAATMGSWRFIIIQSVILAAWIALNVFEVVVRPWDPYPFILLNLMLSFQAAYSAPIIMMSQNRQAVRDRLQSQLDLDTDLKAEVLIEELHGSLDDLRLQKWADLLQLQERQIDMLQRLLGRLESVGTDTEGECPR
jgi:uncharacterized membrane protein